VSSVTFNLSRTQEDVQFWDLFEYLDTGSGETKSVAYEQSLYYIPSGCIIDKARSVSGDSASRR
jgi:hypothetical protein